ncbi:MAG: polysaccharide deacetylase family protein [Thiobacillus sp.]|jgi:peptidoglycan/xylan/chitin deacetylase (PgdA/CDA1 family)
MTLAVSLTRRLLGSTTVDHGPVALMYHSVNPGKNKPRWPWAVSMQQFRDQLDYLAAGGYATPTINELFAVPKRWATRTAIITFDDGYVDNLEACEELQKRGMRATWFVVTGSIGREPGWADEGRPGGRLLDGIELRTMQEAGMEIGSHTVSHQRLPNLDGLRLQSELADSKLALEDVLGREVTSFAYPYGDWNEHCETAVRAAGYHAACTTQTGWAMRDDNPFRLRRLTIYNEDAGSLFVRKLAFARHDVRWPELADYWGSRMRAKLTGRP